MLVLTGNFLICDEINSGETIEAYDYNLNTGVITIKQICTDSRFINICI